VHPIGRRRLEPNDDVALFQPERLDHRFARDGEESGNASGVDPGGIVSGEHANQRRMGLARLDRRCVGALGEVARFDRMQDRPGPGWLLAQEVRDATGDRRQRGRNVVRVPVGRQSQISMMGTARR
jgi:hypothetical protein